jgi:hypothetical protein
MDWNCRLTAKANHFIIDKVVGDKLTKFPIERARSRLSWLLVPVSTAVIVAYGRILQRRVVRFPSHIDYSRAS